MSGAVPPHKPCIEHSWCVGPNSGQQDWNITENIFFVGGQKRGL